MTESIRAWKAEIILSGFCHKTSAWVEQKEADKEDEMRTFIILVLVVGALTLAEKSNDEGKKKDRQKGNAWFLFPEMNLSFWNFTAGATTTRQNDPIIIPVYVLT